MELGSLRDGCLAADGVVPQQLLFTDTAVTLFRTVVETVVSEARKVLGTGGVPTFLT